MKRPPSKDALRDRGYLLGALLLAAGWILSLVRSRARPGEPAALLPGGSAQSLHTYLRSAMTLRQIHSLKLTRAEKWNQRLKFTLIGTSTVATYIGFIGVGDLAADLKVSEGFMNVVLNTFLLLLLIAVIGELAWRFGDRASQHQRAIVVLTSFIRDLENRLRQPLDNGDVTTVHEFGERHALIIEILPAHTDRDYIKAKEAASEKAVTKRKIKAKTHECV